MEFLTLVNGGAAAMTIAAAILIASNYSATAMVAGFTIFCGASLLWMASGFLDSTPSLVVQNVVLLVINAVGIFRWLPKTAE
jgi:hypothetical protein